MNKPIIIGKYLDRNVSFVFVDLENLTPSIYSDLISKSVVLLYFEKSNNKVFDFINSIIKYDPLSVTVSGVDCNIYFDFLLESLSKHNCKNNIMTKVCNENDLNSVLEDMLYSSWPSEEYFNKWSSYLVYVVGGNRAEIFMSLSESNLFEYNNLVLNEENSPKCGDPVRISTTAPEKYRPSELGDVCGIWTVDTEINAEARGEALGTVIYTVEFGDGASIEIPEYYLEKLENLHVE